MCILPCAGCKYLTHVCVSPSLCLRADRGPGCTSNPAGVSRATTAGASYVIRSPSARRFVAVTLTRFGTLVLILARTMLITKTYHDVPTKLDANGRPIRIFIIAPNVPSYPNAKFPGGRASRATPPSVMLSVILDQASSSLGQRDQTSIR